MGMNQNDLADVIKNALGFGADPASSETIGMAQSIIEEFGVGSVTHAPNTVNGAVPSSGGPLVGGSAINGIISGMTGVSLANRLKINMGKPSVSSELLGMANAFVTHFLTGVVSFSSGEITGTCTNTPTSAGVLIGEGSGGEISGYSGSILATLMASSMGKPDVSTELGDMCEAVVSYIMDNAEVVFATSNVEGTCPSGGGALANGEASGGTIS